MLTEPGADATFSATGSGYKAHWDASYKTGTGGFVFVDSTRLVFGTTCDAEIYHDGDNVVINPTISDTGKSFVVGGPTSCFVVDGASSKVGFGTTTPYLKTHIYDGAAGGDGSQFVESTDQFVIENDGNVNMYLLSTADATAGYNWSVEDVRSKAGISVDHTTCYMTFMSGAGSFSSCAYQLNLHNGGSQTVAPDDKVSLGSTNKTEGNTQLTVNTEGTGAVATGTSTATLGATMAVKINGTQYYVMLSTAAAT